MDKLQELRERLWLASAPSRPNVRCSTCGSVVPLRTRENDATEWNDAFNALINWYTEKDTQIARLNERIIVGADTIQEFREKIARLEVDSLTLKRVRAINPSLVHGIENHYAKAEEINESN